MSELLLISSIIFAVVIIDILSISKTGDKLSLIVLKVKSKKKEAAPASSFV